MDWTSMLPGALVFCVFGFVAIVVIGIFIMFLLPILGVAGGAGWYLNKKSKEADAMRKAALSWPSTTGTVISSEIVSSSYYQNHRSQVSYRPKVTYQYHVDGKEFSNDLIKAQDKLYTVSYGTATASEVTAKYPAGSRVTVYYNPDQPQESILER